MPLFGRGSTAHSSACSFKKRTGAHGDHCSARKMVMAQSLSTVAASKIWWATSAGPAILPPQAFPYFPIMLVAPSLSLSPRAFGP